MVQAIIDISKESNHVLNMIKAIYSLSNKSQAIDKLVTSYGAEMVREELKPEFIERMKKIEKEQKIKIRSIDELFR